MIIEGAFFKLPELLISSPNPDQQYESTLISHFAMAVLLEFDARSIQQPLNRIHIEQPYPSLPGRKSLGRADLYVGLGGMFPDLQQKEYARYGIKSSNWLEAKLFARIRARSGTETTVSNAGSIAIDLLRLCLLVPESTWGGPRQNNRYFLAVFDRKPSEYLAFTRQSGEAREWLSALLSPGDKRITIAFHEEPPSFRSASKSQGMRKAQELFAAFRVITTQFGPVDFNERQSFCGFLSRIVGFELRSGETVLHFEDSVKETWDEKESELQSQLAIRFLGPA